MKTLPSAVRHAALGIQEMDHLKPEVPDPGAPEPKVEPISAHLKPILDSIRGGIQNLVKEGWTNDFGVWWGMPRSRSYHLIQRDNC